jgi:hypothetical protein
MALKNANEFLISSVIVRVVEFGERSAVSNARQYWNRRDVCAVEYCLGFSYGFGGFG